MARSYTLEAIDTLVELMRDGKDERVRGTAAQALLDRGWGKAKVEVVTGADGGYLEVLRVVNERLVRGKRDVHILKATRLIGGGSGCKELNNSFSIIKNRYNIVS